MLLAIFDLTIPLKNPVLQFSLILFIILFAPILFNKIRIPYLIGLIIAGALIGPHGFNLMLRDSSIILYGTVGLLYIMFLAGIEIDYNDFRKNTTKSFLFGLFTFIIPMCVGYFIGMYVLKFQLYSTLLLSSMFATHTLLVFPIISKFGIARNRAVGVAVGGTIITDTLALLVLAIVADITKGNYTNEYWLRLGISIAIFASIIIYVFPIICRWFFKNYSDRIAQYIFVLAMVFLGAFLAQAAGVEAIIGAFLTGLTLNRLIPRTSALMNRIEFVGNALFIPIFLIGVGMLIDYKAFLKDFETIKVGVIMTIAATFSKLSVAWLAQKFFGYTKNERRLIFGLINAHVAATLAVVLIGYSIILNQDEINAALLVGKVIEPIRLLNDSVLNGTILMILVTCTHASFVAQRGARKIALEEGTLTNITEGKDEEKILLPISNQTNIQELINLSNCIKSKNNKHGVYALNIVNTDDPNSSDKKAVKLLDTATTIAAATDCNLQKLLRYDLTLSNGIANVVKEQRITDIVLNLVHHSLEDEFLGNTIDNLLKKSDATTIIYKSLQPLSTIKRNIVVVPENAENEAGFPFWINKIWNMAHNTNLKTIIYAPNQTMSTIKEIQKKQSIDAEFKEFQNFSDFLVLSREIKPDDMLSFVLSRKGTTSYNEDMMKVPSYLHQYFSSNNFILIFPFQSVVNDSSTNYKIVSMVDPIEKIDDIGKSIASLFKK